MKKTKFFTNEEQKWVLVDVKDKVLGRAATRIARILQGKHKPTYTPNAYCGDKVAVINAKYIKVTGKKMKQKVYDRYTGYPGGIRFIDLEHLMEKNPTKAMYQAIKGMVPRGVRGRQIMRSLKIYPEAQHDIVAQQPKEVKI